MNELQTMKGGFRKVEEKGVTVVKIGRDKRICKKNGILVVEGGTDLAEGTDGKERA